MTSPRSLGDQQVHQVADVRQVSAVETVGRDRPVQALGVEQLARLGDAGGVRIQAVDQVAVVGPQSRGQLRRRRSRDARPARPGRRWPRRSPRP